MKIPEIVPADFLPHLTLKGISSATTPNDRASARMDRFPSWKARAYMRSHGLISFLQLPEVSDFAGIGAADINRVRNLVKQDRQKLARQAIEARFKATDIVLDLFNEREKEIITYKWPYLVSEESDYAEQFRIHLDLSETFDEDNGQATVYQKLVRFPRFEMSVSGVFVPVESKVDENEVSGDLSYVSAFYQLFRSRDLARHLDMSHRQAREIEVAFKEYALELQDANSKSLNWSDDSGITLDELRAELAETRATAAKRTRKVIDGLLLEPQLEAYGEIAKALLERSAGPFWDIESGSLSEKLGITESTRESLEKSITMARKSFEGR